MLLPAWREVDAFDDQERAALALAEAVTRVADTHVPRDAWKPAAALFCEAELGALLWEAIVANAWNRLCIAVRLTPSSCRPNGA